MQISQETITLIINGVFGVFLIMGFLFGMARGFKKSTLRLVFIVSIATAMYIAAPYISSWLLSLDLSSILNGMTVTIGGTEHVITTASELMTTFLNSSQAIQDFVIANPSFGILVEQLPSIITNLIIFLTGFWILKIVTWPIYAVMAVKYNKKGVDGTKPNKHRFAGGFVGAVQGIVIAIITFMPVAGISSMLNVQSTDGTGANLLGNLLGDSADFLPVYENSAIGFFGSVANTDERMFDGLTTIEVENEKTGEKILIKPRQEVVTGMEIINDIQKLIDMINGIADGSITQINWDLMEKIVTKVFDLHSVELLIEEYAPYLAQEMTTNAEYGFNDEVDKLPVSDDVNAFITKFITSLDEATIEGFKSDALAIIKVGRSLDEYGVVDLIFDAANDPALKELLPEQILSIIASDRMVVNDVIKALLSSNSVRTFMPEGINIILGILENAINDTKLPENYVTITRINSELIDWNIEAEKLTDIIYKLTVFVNRLDPFNMNQVEAIDIADSLELSELGRVINLLRSTQLFGNVYKSIIEAAFSLDEAKVAKNYFNTETLIAALNTTDWEAELDLFEDAIDIYVLINSGNELMAEDVEGVFSRLNNSQLLDIVLDGALNAAFIEGFGETEVPTWVNDLSIEAISANAPFFAEMVEFSFFLNNNSATDLSYEQIQALVDAVQSVNTNITDSIELAKFKGFLNNLIHYGMNKTDQSMLWAANLNIDDLIDNIDTFAEVFKLCVAIEDNSILTYTPTQIDSLITELKELDDMSPELIAVLQGAYNDFVFNSQPFLVDLDINNIIWSEEFDILNEALSMYINYENNNTVIKSDVVILIDELNESYLLNNFLQPIVDTIVVDELGLIAPHVWIDNINSTWIVDNKALIAEIVDLILYSQDNNIEQLSAERVESLLIQVENINNMTDLSGFASFVNGLKNHMINDGKLDAMYADLTLSDLIDNTDTALEIIKLYLAVESSTQISYTQEDISKLTSEINELDNMSPALISLLQSQIDKIDLSEFDQDLQINVSDIRFANEAHIIGKITEIIIAAEQASLPTAASFMSAYESSELVYIGFMMYMSDNSNNLMPMFDGSNLKSDLSVILANEIQDIIDSANNNIDYDLDELHIGAMVKAFNIEKDIEDMLIELDGSYSTTLTASEIITELENSSIITYIWAYTGNISDLSLNQTLRDHIVTILTNEYNDALTSNMHSTHNLTMQQVSVIAQVFNIEEAEYNILA